MRNGGGHGPASQQSSRRAQEGANGAVGSGQGGIPGGVDSPHGARGQARCGPPSTPSRRGLIPRMPVFALENGNTLSCAQFEGAGTICVNLAGKAVAAKPHDPQNTLDVVVADAMGFQRGWAFGYGYIICFYVIVAGFIVLMISEWKAIANKRFSRVDF